MLNRFSFRVYACFIVLLFRGASTVAAQATTGTVAGKITLASSGDPVHGAIVTLVGARRQTTSGDDGKFQIDNVAPGTYEVLVQRDQLSTTRQSVTVVAGQTASLEVSLTIGVHEAVTVTASATGASTAFESFNSITTVDSTAIARRLGATLADVLQNEPGISKRTFGPGTSRPIIRGFDGDRVLIMQDGIRTGDLSSQSGDHGVSIDPAGLSRVEIVKGPATLLYGSNAIGGVVNAITPQDLFRTTRFSGTLGGVSLDGGSANSQGGVSGNAQHGQGALLLYGSFSGRRTGDYDAPDETIPNSATRLVTGEGGAGWNGSRAYLGVSAGMERNRYGIPFAGFLDGDPESQVDLELRRQNIRFDTGMQNLGGRFADAVRIKSSYLDYQHDELDIAEGVESLGTHFSNKVFTLRAEVEQQAGHKLAGRIGAEALHRNYESAGEEALAPATTQDTFAAFAYEELGLGMSGKHRLQFGGRFEHVGYDSDFDEGAVKRAFNAFSGSIGAHASLGSNAALVANLTGASRAPALEELFNFGPHPGNLAFEVGNPDLEIERTLGVDVSLRARGTRSHAEITVFNYNISNFVFLDVTDEIEDGLRVANYLQADSRFTGVDGAVHFDLGKLAELSGGLSYVQAKLTETNEWLPRIPPFQGRLELAFSAKGFSIRPELIFAAQQHHVFRAESVTNGWVTGNIGVSWQRSNTHGSHLIAFQAQNITNQTYRLHTSFLKDLAPEMGRGVKLTYTVRFF